MNFTVFTWPLATVKAARVAAKAARGRPPEQMQRAAKEDMEVAREAKDSSVALEAT